MTRRLKILQQGAKIIGEGNLDFKVGTTDQDEASDNFPALLTA